MGYWYDDNGLVINFEAMRRNRVYIEVIDAWANAHAMGGMNVPHSHPDSDLSGVLYVAVPEGMGEADGALFLEDPRGRMFANDMRLPFAQFNEPLVIRPQSGDIVLFPSWLRHWTSPPMTKEKRISFAFNVKFKGIRMTREDGEVMPQESLKEKATGDIQILKREL